MSKDILAEALELSPAERIELAQDLWDSVVELPEAFDLSDEQRAELNRRLTEYKSDPSGSISWDDLKKKMGL